MDKATDEKAKAAWQASFESTRAKITAEVAKFNYKSAPVRFVGSAQSGRAGIHKGKVRFDASDFDVDLNVPNAADFAAGARRSAPVGGKIFPNMPGYPAALRSVNTNCVNALKAAFPNVTRIETSSIALTES